MIVSRYTNDSFINKLRHCQFQKSYHQAARVAALALATFSDMPQIPWFPVDLNHPLLKGKDQYGWPSCVEYFRKFWSATFLFYEANYLNKKANRTAHIRHQCRKTTVLSCHRCQINTGVEKNELNMDLNFDHQMSLSKSKSWFSNNCLQFLKRAVPLYWAFSFRKNSLHHTSKTDITIVTAVDHLFAKKPDQFDFSSILHWQHYHPQCQRQHQWLLLTLTPWEAVQ